MHLESFESKIHLEMNTKYLVGLHKFIAEWNILLTT